MGRKLYYFVRVHKLTQPVRRMIKVALSALATAAISGGGHALAQPPYPPAVTLRISRHIRRRSAPRLSRHIRQRSRPGHRLCRPEHNQVLKARPVLMLVAVHTAVYVQGSTGDVTGTVRCQEQHGSCNVSSRAHSAHRDGFEQLGLNVLV